MHDETSSLMTARDPNAGRYKHLFRAVLLAIGLCYVLAIPFIADRISWDPGSTGRNLCPHPSSPGFGVLVEEEPGSKFRCKLLFSRILAFWSVYALIFLPIAGPMAALRYVMRRAVDLEGPGSGLQRRDRVVRIVSVSVLFAYAAVGVSKAIARAEWNFVI